jgi:hypothetical protein
MVDWFRTHVFIAAWSSPAIALIGMLLKKRAAGAPVNWSRMMIYVGWLTSFAVMVTPGVDPMARGTAEALVAGGFGFLIIDSGRHRDR